MSDFPQIRVPPWPVIHSFMRDAVGGHCASTNESFGAATSGTWPTTNKAIFVPFEINEPITVTKLWWYDGATLQNGVDCGIYDNFGVRVISTGSQPQASGVINTLRVIDIADTVIQPGRYYLALALNSTTGTIFGANTGSDATPHFGIVVQLSAFPLPAVAVFGRDTGLRIPIFGLLHGIDVI